MDERFRPKPSGKVLAEAGTVERARGRWREILPQLGIEPRFLVNKHGPCPLCGGKDRFRFDDKDGSGSYICGQCGAGVGIILLRKQHGWDHATACREVDKIIGTEVPRSTPQPSRRYVTDRRRADLDRVLAEARDRSIIERYLRGRGLSTVPVVLRGHADLPYFDDDGRLIGRYPAMVAPVLGPDGRLQSLHRTYITDAVPKGERKKLMPVVETAKGAAVRLFDHDKALGIGEGIETSIAAYELFGTPTWACTSTSIMEGVNPPDGVETLIIYADADANFAGHKAAYTLANRLARERKEIAIKVMVPPRPDTDWLDVLLERTGRAA